MTAEEFYLKKTGWESLDSFEEFDHPEDVVKYMIEFAKYRVEQALKEASEKACLEVENYKGKHLSIEESLDDYTDCRVNKESILNAYPLENIK
jgi:hypothetical protein